ncbi:hypothetical protein KEM55_004052 [Ascosphaera atra]|nr:hypothetical protein KEM55_004052 [Ascosphaera atra]
MADLVRGIVVFSGGSAANNLVDVFDTLRQSKECTLSYIIPMSDNGGSSSELIRIFGGPGIGDLRSRLVRLIPRCTEDSELAAIKALVSCRLSSCPDASRNEWLSIVDGTSNLWERISPAKKELIRSFLNLVNMEILKRARPPTVTFDFASASVGNLFLTGGRLFSGSIESAVYLLASICSVPVDRVRVIPSINSNFTNHIAASLEDGTVIVGQNRISHPSQPTSLEPTPRLNTTHIIDVADEDDHPDSPYVRAEDDQLPGSLPSLRQKNILFSKSVAEDLPSRISKIWYINPYGQEIRPPASPRVVDALSECQTIIYSIGSLFTSIVPSVILKGVGKAIVTSKAQQKILILNGSIDRETGPASHPFTALDFVEAIVQAGEQSRGRRGNAQKSPPTEELLPESVSLEALRSPPEPQPVGLPPSTPSIPYTSYVTHLLHLDGAGTPYVDREALAERGIKCIRLIGRMVVDEDGLPSGAHYDPAALTQALEVVIGKKGDAVSKNSNCERTRRNTMGNESRESVSEAKNGAK